MILSKSKSQAPHARSSASASNLLIFQSPYQKEERMKSKKFRILKTNPVLPATTKCKQFLARWRKSSKLVKRTSILKRIQLKNTLIVGCLVAKHYGSTLHQNWTKLVRRNKNNRTERWTSIKSLMSTKRWIASPRLKVAGGRARTLSTSLAQLIAVIHQVLKTSLTSWMVTPLKLYGEIKKNRSHLIGPKVETIVKIKESICRPDDAIKSDWYFV